jgi:hypothetical protein
MLLVMLFDWLFGFASSWVFGNGQELIPSEWFQGGDPSQTAVPTESGVPAETPAATP